MPDGLSILYANENELDVIRPEDGISVPYVRLQGRAFWLRWSPDGTLLRFTLVNPVTHASTIWQMDSRSRVPRPVPALEGKHLAACCGVWTADGGSYVFQADDNLWKMTGSGRGAALVQLTNGPLRFLSPVASRSGARIFLVGLESPSGLQELDGKHHEFKPAPGFLANANRIEYSRDGK